MIPRTVRLKLNYNLTPGDNDETLIEAWKGDALRVQFGIFDNSLPVDISDISSVEMRILSSQTTTDAALAMSDVANADMTTIPNVARWNSGAMQNGTIEFTAIQMNQAITGVDDDFWWVITATNSDGQCTLGCGTFRMINQNSDTVGSPPTNPAAGITQTAADARYMGILADSTLNKRGSATITNSTSSGTVTFATAFASAPTQIICTVQTTGSTGAMVFACVHTISTTGFTYELNGEIPASGTYKLHWIAI